MEHLGELSMPYEISITPHEDITKWKNKGGHLPTFLRSLENQENFIRFLYHYYQSDDQGNPFEKHSHAVIKKYVFGVFFDVFADNGLTLQPIRNKSIRFMNLEKELTAFHEYENGIQESFVQQTSELDNMNAIEKYRRNLLFLPEFMNEFDKFKLTFRSMHRMEEYRVKYKASFQELDDRDGAILMIDFILWACAKYGYKMQQTRKKLPFNPWM